MHIHLKIALEDAIVTLHLQFADVDPMQLRNHLRHLMQQTQLVESLHMNRGREQRHAAHLPLGCQDPIAMIGLQFLCLRTLHLMDEDVLVIIDITHHHIARDGLAAITERVFIQNGIFRQRQSLLAVKVRPHLLLLGDQLLRRLLTEREEFLPTARLRLPLQHVKVSTSQFHLALSNRHIQGIRLGQVM